MHHQPTGRDDIGLRRCYRRNPRFWRNHHLVRIRIKPGAPPTEAAVGDDVMTAHTHKVHVFCGAA